MARFHTVAARQGVAERRRAERGIVAISLSVSVALHVVVFQLQWPPPTSGGAVAVPGPRNVSGMRVVRLAPAQLELDELTPPSAAELVEPAAEVEAEPISPERPEPPAPAPAAAEPPTPSATSPRVGQPLPGAAGRLRSGGRDPRLFAPTGVPPAAEHPSTAPLPHVEVEERIWDEMSDAISRQSPIGGPDSLLLSTWGDESADGLSVQPGALTLGGVRIPFCGGPDASRCGFGARPWDLEAADQWRAFLKGLEEQGRWEAVQDRARTIRPTGAPGRDTVRTSG